MHAEIQTSILSRLINVNVGVCSYVLICAAHAHATPTCLASSLPSLWAQWCKTYGRLDGHTGRDHENTHTHSLITIHCRRPCNETHPSSTDYERVQRGVVDCRFPTTYYCCYEFLINLYFFTVCGIDMRQWACTKLLIKCLFHVINYYTFYPNLFK